MCNYKTPFRTCARCTVVVFLFCVKKCFECSDLVTEKTYLDIKQYGVYVKVTKTGTRCFRSSRPC